MSERIEARLSVSADHPSLPGHFPGQPVVPGVLLLERVIEAAEQALGSPLRVLGLPQVKFLAPLLPDEEAVAVLEWPAKAPNKANAQPEASIAEIEANARTSASTSSIANADEACTRARALSIAPGEGSRVTSTLRFRVERGGQALAQGTFEVERCMP